MSRYEVNRVLYDSTRKENRDLVRADKAAFLARYTLSEGERRALAGPSFRALLDLGGLPNLVYRYYSLHGLNARDFVARLAAERSEQTAE